MIVMNAYQKLCIVSHPLRISRYGAHTSLSTAERVEIIDALSEICNTGFKILAQLNQARLQLKNVSFLPVQQLFHRLVRANVDYVDFMILHIKDLGGYADVEMLHSLYDVRDTKCFPACIHDVHLETNRLFAADVFLRDCYECAVARRDNASERYFEACVLKNKHFTSLIQDNLLNGRPL